jgi:3-hydroxyisobutyrate dehydrogenase-like beta-hydroxyacid dehydrogenase
MRVAFLGLGIMGSRMAGNLAGKGFELTVWNRTASTADAFAAEHPGVTVAATPREAANGAELVLSMVVDGPQVERVLLGADGAAEGAGAGTIFADCSTIGPAEARRIGAALAERGGFRLLDAPVTGSSPRAQDGTLTIMVGGDAADYARALPTFEAMGALIVHAGPLGHGQLIKVINNAVAAVNTSTVGQALLVGAAAGADLDALVRVMGAGSGGSAMLELKSTPMREHDYATLFKLDHMLKDLRLCLEAAHRAGVPFAAAEATEEILAAASEMGHGEHDFAALIASLEVETGTSLENA